MKRLALGMALSVLLALGGCGGGSSSGGHHDPLKAVCQACTVGGECESGRCERFNSGIWRCVPAGINLSGYRCPSGMYKLPGDEDSCN